MEPLPMTFAAAPDYEPRHLRPALEKVFAPQLAASGPLAGRSVLLKPNLLCWRKAEDPACVHPQMIVEIARLFRDAGAGRIALMENPAVQTAPAIIRSMGIAEALRKLDVEVANFARYRSAPELAGRKFQQLILAEEFRDFDFVADVAKVKTHGMMTLTLCVKNLFGLVSGRDRMGWHLTVRRDFARFAELLLDLYWTVRPQFNFLDGVVAMEGNGPGSGTPRPCGFVAGGSDALALDAAAAPLLGVPDLLLLQCAEARQMLVPFTVTGDVPQLEPLKLPDPPGWISRWGMPLPPFCKELLRDLWLSRPVLDVEKCVGCGVCAKMCPPQSLKIVDGKAKFDLPNCIRCYCCQEHCPQGAIRPVQPLLPRTLGKAAHGLRNLWKS